jgi:hypothetical protein
MADGSPFPDTALVILRQTRWNPRAAWRYEGLSGGLVWDDELPREAIEACGRVDSWAHRYVLGYRASLIRGEPSEGLRAAWDQLARECPEWPGFRPERQAAELREQLEAASARFLAAFEALFDGPTDAKQVATGGPKGGGEP